VKRDQLTLDVVGLASAAILAERLTFWSLCDVQCTEWSSIVGDITCVEWAAACSGIVEASCKFCTQCSSEFTLGTQGLCLHRMPCAARAAAPDHSQTGFRTGQDKPSPT
jgi:hypothetical protein